MHVYVHVHVDSVLVEATDAVQQHTGGVPKRCVRPNRCCSVSMCVCLQAGGPWRRDDSVLAPVQPTAAAVDGQQQQEEEEEEAAALAQYVAGACTVSMPTDAGPARWRLVATYPLPGISPGPAGEPLTAKHCHFDSSIY